MSWLDEMARDHKAHERDFLAATLTWGNVDYPCSLTTAEDAIQLAESGGSIIERTFSVHIRQQSLEGDDGIWDWRGGGGPQEGNAVTVTLRDEGGTWSGTTYVQKVGKVGNRTELLGRLLKLQIVDATQ